MQNTRRVYITYANHADFRTKNLRKALARDGQILTRIPLGLKLIVKQHYRSQRL